jgi:hypothetical protein
MEFIIAYLEQDRIDTAEKWLGRKLTWEERLKKMSRVKCDSLEGANRLIDRLRLDGCIAYLDETTED